MTSKPSHLFQMAEGIFAAIEPHLNTDQCENVKDAVQGYFLGEPQPTVQVGYDL